MMTRIVMMKMMRSTNITSTRGVTLMSDIASASSPPTLIAMDYELVADGRGGWLGNPWRRLGLHAQSHLGARNKVGMQLMSEMADHFLHTLIAAQQDVVAQHRGHRDGQTDGGHDQCFTDGACHLVDGSLTGHTDGDERVVDADDRAQQTDERRGRTDGREYRQS